MMDFLRKMIPSSVKRKIKRMLAPLPKDGWFGNYRSWKEAEQLCTGYDADNILETVKNAVVKVKNGEAAYERDSVVFDEIQYSEELVDALRAAAEQNGGALHVTDFGGSLGSSYFQNRSFLSDLNELKWSVVEQKHFVDCGREFIAGEQLKFFYTMEEALQFQRPHFLLVSSVIQYFEEPYALIKRCLELKFEYIIIDRTAFVEGEKERITVQVVPETIYKASYPAWFLNEKKFVNAFSDSYQLLREFDSKFDPKERLEDGVLAYRKGFVFKLKK